jgi:2-polyprenyl-3-methyl-5-hydroxy-6-metoxy-1,4-benzoquinol methylase
LKMGAMDNDDSATSPRVLVAVASYGTSNDCYLQQIIREYKSMTFDIDIVVLSNVDKKYIPGVECVVGLPTRDPWSLPFAHKKLFADRRDRYDLFIYSEDDILITERNLRAWLDAAALLAEDEIAGFLRVEYGSNGARSYPDVHGHFHWDPSSVRRRGDYVLAHFTNEHAACYVLTRQQLRRALNSGGFDIAPHEGSYDLACTAATDPYTQCGLTKLIPISHLDQFTVHHMSNRYVGKVGVTADKFDKQTDALLQIAQGAIRSQSLVPTKALFRHGLAYSKDYYEPVIDQVTSLIPTWAGNVLSIGCGSGATERWLAEKGLRVAAIPLDPVIAANAAAKGVTIYERAELPGEERFDCVLCLNILHLAPNPQELLSLSYGFMHQRSTLVVQTPNMMSLRALRHSLKIGTHLNGFVDYESNGMHFSSKRTVRKWCINAGFKIERTLGILAHRGDGKLGSASAFGKHLPRTLSLPLATSIIMSATKAKMDARQIRLPHGFV